MTADPRAAAVMWLKEQFLDAGLDRHYAGYGEGGDIDKCARIAADFAERLAMADRAILREAVDNTVKDKAFLRAVKQLSVADYHARVPLPWAEAMQEGAIDEAERKLHAEVRAYLAGEP